MRFHLLYLPSRVLASGPDGPPTRHVSPRSRRIVRGRCGKGNTGHVGSHHRLGRKSESPTMKGKSARRLGLINSAREIRRRLKSAD